MAPKVAFDAKYGHNEVDISLENSAIIKAEFDAKYGHNEMIVPISTEENAETVQIGFDIKYGINHIEVIINTCSGNGLSDLFSETFTIINQIPTSQTIATKTAWKKHTIKTCDRRDGIFDKSTNTMTYKANSWSVWCKDWTTYKPPNWQSGGYYTLADDEKSGFWTANVGDLIIFGEVDDVEPATLQEFTALVKKYSDNGGIITQAQSYINYKPNCTPWVTNHIEIIKG